MGAYISYMEHKKRTADTAARGAEDRQHSTGMGSRLTLLRSDGFLQTRYSRDQVLNRRRDHDAVPPVYSESLLPPPLYNAAE